MLFYKPTTLQRAAFPPMCFGKSRLTGSLGYVLYHLLELTPFVATSIDREHLAVENLNLPLNALSVFNGRSDEFKAHQLANA